MQNIFSRCTTIFRDSKQFFTVQNKLSRYKTIFHGAQQAFEIQNKFSRCTTSFRDAVDTYVEQNSVSRCKIKFHDAQQKFGRLVTSTGNFISCDHTTSCSLPPCFVNTRATQLTMAASLLPTGDEKEIITYYFSRGYEYDAIVHFLAKFHDITMSIRTLMNLMREFYPDGCEQRRSRALQRRRYSSPRPNHTWHVDGYDKLKPVGFPVHCCIDGWSRRIMWLKLTRPIRFSTTCLGTCASGEYATYSGYLHCNQDHSAPSKLPRVPNLEPHVGVLLRS